FGFGGILAKSIQAQQKTDVFSVIAGLGGQEVTYEDIADFIRKRRIGEEIWFGVNDHV
ncbi:MAG: pyruvate ferredoxin oxidoreductase, partial [Methanoregula sp.]|nr:pyruvate ferredoxin oxidoreductase [Methanoregula sp.]